jgi:hypothetical protein
VQYAKFGTTCTRKLLFPPKACTTDPSGSYKIPMTAATCARNTYTSTTTSTSGCINASTTTHHSTAQALRQPYRAPRVLVSRPQRLYIDNAVRRRDVVFWVYNYFDYSSRLVSTRKLVEDGSRASTTSRIHLQLVDFSSNRRGSITDRHGFVDSRPRIKLSHLFQ